MTISFSDPIAWEETLPIRQSSPAWRSTVRAIYGTPLSPEELAVYRQLSGGIDPPEGGADSALVVAGRRAGKSETVARICMFEALYGGHAVALAPGQRGILSIQAHEIKAAREILGYCRGIAELPQVKRGVEEILETCIRFRNGLVIQMMTGTSDAARSGTIVFACLDEIAFFAHEPCADPDVAVIAALRPALAPIKGAPRRRLLAITSAGVRAGWAYDTYAANHGQSNAPTLVLHGTTAQFNPNIDPNYLEQRRKESPQVYAREHESVWSDSITEGWFGATAIANAVDKGRTVPMPPEPGLRYHLAVDAASATDGWAAAIACSRWVYTDAKQDKKHRLTHLAAVKVWLPQPGRPLDIRQMIHLTRQFAAPYNPPCVLIDQWSSAALVEMFRDAGLKARVMPWTAGAGPESKHGKFSSTRDGMNDGSIRLPDDPLLLAELANITAEALPSGGERLRAARGHDDLVTASVMALAAALAAPPSWPTSGGGQESRWDRQQREQGMRRIVLSILG